MCARVNRDSMPQIDNPKPRCFGGQLSLYAFTHACVDFACAYLVLDQVYSIRQNILALILYNFFAFAGQMPIGILADKFNRNALLAALGCILILLAYGLGLLGEAGLMSASIVAGIGNALFHMGGGIDVLNASGKKSGPLGIFVSPGAFGLFVGTTWGLNHFGSAWIPCGFMLLCALGIIAFQYKVYHCGKSQNEMLSFDLALPAKLGDKARFWGVLSIASLFIVVTLRSYVGLTTHFDWKSQGYFAIILTLALVLGKALGGVLSDRFGMRIVACISLILAACLYLVPESPFCGIGAVFLFNMTMPMTLWALSQIFHHARGFAFGTLTMALFVGFAITVAHPEPLISTGVGTAVASVASLVLLLLGLRAVKQGASLE